MEYPADTASNSPQTYPDMTVSVPVSPKTIVPPRHAPPAQQDGSQNEAGAHGRWPESIDALSFQFLVKVQQAFGQHSSEWMCINQALLQFKRGAMSKRDAYHIMSRTLSERPELSRDLSNILTHKNAAWGPGDWAHPTHAPESPQAINTSSPNFLQPSHEPQLFRLPPMFEALGGSYGSRPQTSINPNILQSSAMPSVNEKMAGNPYITGQALPGHLATNTGYIGPQEPFMPPSQQSSVDWAPNHFMSNNFLSMPHPSQDPALQPHNYVPPSWYQDPTFAQLRDVDQGPGLQANPCTAQPYHQYQQQQNWQTGNYMGGGTHDSTWNRGPEFSAAEHQTSYLTPKLGDQSTSPFVSGQPGATASPSAITTPTMRVLNVPELFREELNGGQADYSAIAQDSNFSEEASPGIANSDKKHTQSELSGVAGVEAASAQPIPRPEGGFIHAICGKGFHSRSAVKKHHWGPKAGDLTTTRGCWAKNNRPDVEWDAHPSCDPWYAKSNSIDSQAAATEDVDAALVSPNSRVASTAATLPKRGIVQKASADPGHGLDSLVSAARCVVDAPKSHDGRSDSMVARLHAQAAIAERPRGPLGSWVGTDDSIAVPTIWGHTGQMPPPAPGSEAFQESSSQMLYGKMLPSQHLVVPAGQDSYPPRFQEGNADSKMDTDAGRKRQRAMSQGKKTGVSEGGQQEQRASQSWSPDQKRAKLEK